MKRFYRYFPILFLLFIIFICPSMDSQKSGYQPELFLEKIKKYRIENEIDILQEYSQFLSIANPASDRINIQKNADHIVSILKKRKFKTLFLRIEGSPPAVYGELRKEGAKHTILLYSHYDGIPVEPEKWASNPWKAVLRDKPLEEGGKIVSLSEAKGKIQGEWRLYARSSSDEKAAIMAMIAGIDALNASHISLSVNIKVLFEGEEEIGSPHMFSLLEKHKDLLKADALLLCGGPVHSSRRHVVYFGARGGINLDITVYGAKSHLHSGHYGNWAPNPIALLSNLISSMRDSESKILMEGFYDFVRPLTKTEHNVLKDIPTSWDEELRQELSLAWSEADNAPLVERIILPALNLGSIHSGPKRGAAAIPKEAKVSIGFRLVPDQTPKMVRDSVEKHICQQGFYLVYETQSMETRIKHPKITKLQWEKGSLPVRTSMDLPFSRALIQVLEDATGEALIKMPSIGSIAPMELFKSKLKAPVIIFPIVNHDNNQHGPNENVRIQNLRDGIELYASLFAHLGHFWK